MPEAPREVTDAELAAIVEGLNQFAGLLEQMAAYAAERGDPTNPGQELYWGGYVDGLTTAAQTAREMRPLRGIPRN